MTDNKELKNLILCFGETLWDVFPNEKFPGGAPLNVAYHLHQLGYRAAPVTAIGRGRLGIKLLHQMQEWNLDLSFITQVDDRLTGIVEIVLDDKGNATYDIRDNVAWDWIMLKEEQFEMAEKAVAIVFGTLALRKPQNKIQLMKLMAHASAALKVYDVNLRPPHTPHETVWEIAKRADVIKLNEEELNMLLSTQKRSSRIEEKANLLAKETECNCVCVTSGEKGAGLLFRDNWYWADARPVKVKDTVGAGDAFLAALVDGLLSNSDPQAILEKACRLGEVVAASRGATPNYRKKLVVSMPERSLTKAT